MASPAPSSLSHDDGGFTPSWVNQQEHQLGTMQSTEQTRREIQEMPSARPPADDDDEESECRAVVYQTEFNFVLIIHVVMLLLSVKLQFPSIDPHRSLLDRLQSTGLRNSSVDNEK